MNEITLIATEVFDAVTLDSSLVKVIDGNKNASVDKVKLVTR